MRQRCARGCFRVIFLVALRRGGCDGDTFPLSRYDVDAEVAARLRESVRVALQMGHPELLQLYTNTADIEVDLLSEKVSLWSYVEEPPQIESDVFQFIAFLTFIVQVKQSFVHYFRDCLSEATVALGASNVRKVVWGSGSPAIAHMFGLFELIFVLESMKKVETYCCNVFSDDIPKNCLEVRLFDLDEKCTLPEWMIHLPA